MKEWIQKQIDAGFRDLQGLSISAHVPLKDQILNDLLAEALRGAASPAEAQTEGGPDLRTLVQFVKKAEVHSTEGVLVVDIEISV